MKDSNSSNSEDDLEEEKYTLNDRISYQRIYQVFKENGYSSNMNSSNGLEDWPLTTQIRTSKKDVEWESNSMVKESSFDSEVGMKQHQNKPHDKSALEIFKKTSEEPPTAEPRSHRPEVASDPVKEACHLKLALEIQNDDDDSDDDDFVYPLSVKYDAKKGRSKLIIKYTSLALLLILLGAFFAFSTPLFRRLPFRIGYFADQITEETLSFDGVTEIAIQTRDCIVYLLENTASNNEIDLYISAPRSTTINTPLEGTIQKIDILSDVDSVKCYVEIKIPGGVTIQKLSLNYEGDKIPDLMLYDYKGDSTWNSPLKVTLLDIKVADSYPNILFQNAHEITELTVSGTYCVATFNKLKISKMTFAVTLGSLSIVQNSAIPVNKMTVRTPYGTHCVSGNEVKTVDSNCPTQTTRDAGISGTFINTATYCSSELYVCSDSAGSCPASGTAAAAGQGSFTITLDDGPVQLLIDGSSLTQSSWYGPTLDTMTISSQIKLSENKDDFSTEPQDPRIYLYEVVSPGYAKMWTHSSLKQYIEARPWLISLLSVNLLRPTYYRDTLVHIPGGACPYAGPDSVKTNTLISEKIKELSYIETRHLVSLKDTQTYFEYVLTAENEYVKNEIVFLGDTVLIWICLFVSLLLATLTVIFVTLISLKILSGIRDFYNKYLEESKKFSEAKKANSGSKTLLSLETDTDTRSSKIKQSKILIMGLVSLTTKKPTYDPKEQTSDLKGSGSNKKILHRADLSFYKMIDINIDYILRVYADSFKMFIKNIYPDSSRFTNITEESEHYFQQTSIRLDLLQSKYLEFCTKNGYRSTNIEKQTATLEMFNLKIEKSSSSDTHAYLKIRWKTNFEKYKKDLVSNKSKRHL